MANWWRTVVVVGALVVAGCGDPNLEASGANEVPATEAPAEPQDVPPTIVDEQGASVAPPQGEPLGGVTIDDPLPAQADADADPAVAEAAVRYAYQHYILVDLDKDLRAVLIENGEANVDGIAEGFEAARGVVHAARVQVNSVTFTSAITADVMFNMRWQDGPSPYFSDEIAGTAMFQNGTWRLTGRTLCVLSFGAGLNCSAPDAQLPTVPAALTIIIPPELGLVPEVPEQSDTISVPGGATWGTPDGSYVNVQLQSLIGITEMSIDDIDVVLASGRFGAHDGVPVEVGVRGRLQTTPTDVTLLVLRDDGVLVTVSSLTLDAETLITLATSLTAASFTDDQVPVAPTTTLG
jgi:hypothetical protein